MSHRSFRLVPLALGLTLLLGSGCWGSSAATSRETEPATGSGPALLEIANISNEPIYYIHMSPSGERYWGRNLLGSDVLYVGEVFVISNIAAGYWDVRVVDSSGNYKEFYEQYFADGGAYALDVSSGDWYRN